MTEITSVVSEKGGVGKTSVVITLAMILAAIDLNVLVIDSDRTRGASAWAEQLAAHDALSFDIIAETNPDVLRRIREVKQYDVVLVDTAGDPRSLKELRATIEASDLVIVPTNVGFLDFKGCLDTLKSLVIPARVPYRVLLTRIDSRSLTELYATQERLKEASIPTFTNYVRQLGIIKRLPGEGLTLADIKGDDGATKARADLNALAMEFLAVSKKVAR